MAKLEGYISGLRPRYRHPRDYTTHELVLLLTAVVKALDKGDYLPGDSKSLMMMCKDIQKEIKRRKVLYDKTMKGR